MDKEFDILLYGATSYTAQFVIPYLENCHLKVGVASRSGYKLQTNLQHIKCSLLDAPVKTNIIINCVGPYHITGEEMIKKCIESGTHYIDICGEVHFIRKMHEKYHNEALKAKVFIVSACGFDSLIADVGTEVLKNEFDRDIEIRSVLELKNTLGNFGTWKSLLDSLSQYKVKKDSKQKSGTPKYFYDKNVQSNVVKFQGSDFFVVTSTQKLLKGLNMKTCKYEAYLKMKNIFLYFFYFFIISFMSKFSIGKKLLLQFYRFFTCRLIEKSPCRHKVLKGSFKLSFEGVGMKNANYITRNLVVSGPDVYTTTGICLSQTALVLNEMLQTKKDGNFILNLSGGVLTPGFLLRETDIKARLIRLGITFNFQN